MSIDKKTRRYLGVDWGEKRIGLALGDDETGIATPLGVVDSVAGVLDLTKEEEIDKIIIGLPVKMSGAKNETSPAFDKFVKYLRDNSGIPVEFMDERLTSKAADALLKRGANPLSPRLRRAGAARDSIAAMLILQAYLDKS
ncbi:MAG: Holliday junction resolvase RuvX [Candidatus Falkowbacteria bacterium]